MKTINKIGKTLWRAEGRHLGAGVSRGSVWTQMKSNPGRMPSLYGIAPVLNAFICENLRNRRMTKILLLLLAFFASAMTAQAVELHFNNPGVTISPNPNVYGQTITFDTRYYVRPNIAAPTARVELWYSANDDQIQEGTDFLLKRFDVTVPSGVDGYELPNGLGKVVTTIPSIEAAMGKGFSKTSANRWFIGRVVGDPPQARQVYVSMPPADFKGCDLSATTANPDVFFDVQDKVYAWGGLLNVKFAVQNLGGTATLPAIDFVVSKNNIIGDSDDKKIYSLIYNQEVATFSILGSSQYISIQLPDKNPFGDDSTSFYVGMKLDPNNTSGDSNPTNNYNQGPEIDLDPFLIPIYSGSTQLVVSESGKNLPSGAGNLINYGDVVVDGKYKSFNTKTFTLTNIGLVPLRVSNISLKSGQEFRIQSISGLNGTINFDPVTLPVIDTGSANAWKIQVDYDPQQVLTSEDQLLISSEDTDNPFFPIGLVGNGITPTVNVPFTYGDSSQNWWVDNSLIDFAQYSTLSDDMAVVAGQLKNYATAAYKAMEARLPGGAGFGIKNLVTGWSYTDSNNDTAINIGQLKNIAQPFYDRLIELGLTTSYPWTATTADDDDSHVAALGQLKMVFAFPIPIIPTTTVIDSDGDGLPDTWEIANFGNLSRDGSGDFDGDGLLDKDEYAKRTDPTKSDSDGDGISDKVEVAANLNPLANDGALDSDNDGVPNDQDLDPANASVGALTIQIITPANGSTVP